MSTLYVYRFLARPIRPGLAEVLPCHRALLFRTAVVVGSHAANPSAPNRPLGHAHVSEASTPMTFASPETSPLVLSAVPDRRRATMAAGVLAAVP